jgi:glucose-6-phosphate 1-dehydrogenase
MLDLEMPLPPCNFVIFGATGNLASNKLLPALYRLELAKKLPAGLNFVAFGRREWDDSALRNHVRERLVRSVKAEEERLEHFVARFEYLRGELHDSEAYTRLKALLAKPKLGSCSNIVFYLAIKPVCYQKP